MREASLTDPSENATNTARVAAACALTMIAVQVAAKAARDTLFLSYFDVTLLPRMVVVSAITSIAVIPVGTRLMSRLSPARFVPLAFGTSALGLVLIALVCRVWPGPAAVLLYLQIGGLGALLVSGFWSVVNEILDPRSGKRHIATIGRAATFGGLVGGILAERVSSFASIEAILPVLGVLHLVCGGLVYWLGYLGQAEEHHTTEVVETETSGLRILAGQGYLRHLAILVVVLGVAVGLVDYLFKAEATAHYQGEDLLRFFAIFYAAIGLLTFAVQSLATGQVLQRLGLGRTVAVLPGALTVGGLGALFVPGLGSAVTVRCTEEVLRNSLHRSSYELLYVPLPRNDKRRTKALIDVGFKRLGDAAGGLTVSAVLAVGVATAPTLNALVIALGAVAIGITLLLSRGYVQALETSLVSRAAELDLLEGVDGPTQDVLRQTLGAAELSSIDPRVSQAVFSTAMFRDAPAPIANLSPSAAPTARLEPVVQRIVDLRSGDIDRVRRSLRGELSPEVVSHVIGLLAWDDVAKEAITALSRTRTRVVRQLVDALLDADEAFAIRRRIPRVLGRHPSERAARGLLDAMSDRRFEVRYQCSRALVRMRRLQPDLPLHDKRVRAAIVREVEVERPVWKGRRLLDRLEDTETEWMDGFLRDRSNRSLEHVFALLSLILPPEPLLIAYRGLQTDDRSLRGTALEYLENVLPESIRAPLWPFLDDAGRPASDKSHRPVEQVLDDLLKSHQSIQLNLEELRRLRDSQESVE